MTISILTLFPEMFSGPFDCSIIKRAKEKGKLTIEVVNLRDFGIGRHKIVDDRPYGGGVGMILRVDVIDKALQATIRNKQQTTSKRKIILLDARGKTFNQDKARGLSKLDHLILIAGHYEGVDERVRGYLADESISIGDYVLTGGEIPAMVIIDAVVRLIPGVLEKPEAIIDESFSNYTLYPKPSTLLEYPQYTRPRLYRGWKVPEILLSGNHQQIEKWKKLNQKLKKEA